MKTEIKKKKEKKMKAFPLKIRRKISVSTLKLSAIIVLESLTREIGKKKKKRSELEKK